MNVHRILIALAVVSFARPAFAAKDAVSFKQDVAPILVKQCQTCHGPDKAKSRYRLDTFDHLKTPG